MLEPAKTNDGENPLTINAGLESHCQMAHEQRSAWLVLWLESNFTKHRIGKKHERQARVEVIKTRERAVVQQL